MSKMPPMISIIMPVYNAMATLPTALASALRQDFKWIEIIAVDDGSTDQSLQMLQNVARQDPRVVVIQQKNGGPGPARNAALKIARGEYIAFLDSDDQFLDTQSLGKLYVAITERDADICGGNFTFIDEKDKEFLPPNDLVFAKRDFFYGDYVPLSDGFFWRHLFKKSFLQKNNIVFPDYFKVEDPIFLLKSFECKPKVQLIMDVIYAYRKPRVQTYGCERGAADFVKHYRDVLDFCARNKWPQVAHKKTMWVRATQWEHVLVNCAKMGTDISALVDEINTLIDAPEARVDMPPFLKKLPYAYSAFKRA